MAPTKRRDDCHKVDEQLDVEDCDAVIAHAPKKIAVPNLQPTRVRRGTKSAQIAANNKCGPTKSKSAVDEANTIEADRKEFTPSANPIIVDSGSFEESRATIKPRVDADVRRPKSGRQRIESEPKNIKLVEKVRREKESKDNTNGEGALLIVLDSSSEDDSTGRKGDRNSAVTGARISSKASGCEARAANDKPPNATFGLGSSLQSCTNDIPSKVEKEPQKNANNRRTVESQTVPDSSSSSDEENAPSQRAPSVFISPPRALELRDKNIEFLVTTRRRNRILHFKEGDLDSPAIDGAASRGGDVPPASGTEQNPMEVLSSLPPAHKERDPIQNPRPERKKTARPPNLLQKLLVQREESLKARTPSRIMDAHIGTGSKSIIAGDTNPIFDDQTRKGSIFVSNRLIDESHTCQSLDHRNNSKQDANPFVVPSSVNRAKENHEKPLYNIDHVLDSFSNLSISTKTKVPTNDSTSTLKPEITKQYGQRGRGDKPLADRRNEASAKMWIERTTNGSIMTKRAENNAHEDSLGLGEPLGTDCRSNESDAVERQQKHKDYLMDDFIGAFNQLDVGKGETMEPKKFSKDEHGVIQKAAESAERHPDTVRAKAQTAKVNGKVRRRLVIHSDEDDSSAEGGGEDWSKQARPQTSENASIQITSDQTSDKGMHNTKSIEGKRRLRAIYVSSDDELSPVKRVDRPKLQPSSVQKRVDAAKNIHHPAVSSHPTVSTPHNILLDPAVPPARKGRPKISDQELNSTTPVPVRNPPKSVWSPEDRPAAVPSTPKTVKRKLFVSSTATTGTANREHLSYKKERETIAIQLYKEFNEIVFGSLLPDDLEISWSAKLVATAGISRLVTRKNTKTGTVTRKATIELSNKVLDTKERLRSTLAHEMCHIAAFWIDGITKPPHGAVFKKWGQKVMRCYSDIEVTTCHSYEIAYTHWYECENMFCGRRYGRFSKSIDVQSQRCGICGGKLRYLDRNCKDGKPRKENLFQAFLKERLKPTKEIFPGLPHKEVMRILSDEWKEVKSSWIAGREGLQTAKDAVPPTYGGDDLGVEEDDDDDESSEEDLSFVVPDEESIDQE